MILDLGFVFISSLAYLFILRKAARKVGLVDKPNARKLHSGLVPLIGGISICLVLIQYLHNNKELLPHSQLYAGCIFLLTIIGALDDRYDISFKIRFLVQGGLSGVMMYFADISLLSLGDMFGFGETHLGWAGYVITVFAVIGAINAFNMVDGIDGLLGGLSCVTFGSLGTLLYLSSNESLAYFCLVICTATLPYVLFNLGAFGKTRKVFMGDAGSMLIGFTVIWLLLLSSQEGSSPPLRPVTALWLIAVPLMDMAAVMIRRIRRGHSPFKPDREHLHHICQHVGLNSSQTLVFICMVASAFSIIGMIGECLEVSESLMFYSFLVCFAGYICAINNIWRITSFFRKSLSDKEQVKNSNEDLASINK
ncbi:UDP-N-acetylglucosamine--undecaprenyl-phosphate N-acetylglucosaminephosphotransferase [Vibrio diabolicus]|uniref:UDP-N-acetylglucosamine--undecaprenyl-phosphate N-acetylglucosaminephosphotransferase n=1 Tax=Vibrio diabolicus TaxID=50719 RepID=UPI00232D0001|nr:UDP-N-acetylglucosamine--undecaprenyl-phosphate N-acetylglucosaminephosphotransferase [Vibrio diabolicus]